MNRSMNNSAGNNRPSPSVGARAPLKCAFQLLLVGAISVAGYFCWKSHQGRTESVGSAVSEAVAPDTREATPVSAASEEPVEVGLDSDSTPSALTIVETVNRSAVVPAQSQASAVEPTPEMRQLVATLTQFQAGGGTLTAEQAEAWKQGLRALIEQGRAAVPAIREFLEQNRDITFGGANALGYSSLRSAFFDALQQIGGADAQGVMLQTLQNTAVPSEIARLARYLEQQAPGQYRDQIAAAARDTLAQAAEGQLRGWDLGPIFQVLQTYGDSSVAAELERNASKWNYYSAFALANLPSGEGIPSLIHLAQESSSSSSRGVALEALAQVAVQNPNATAAMVELARGGKISDRYWLGAAAALGGDRWYIRDSGSDTPVPVASGVKTYHLEASNQNFYTTPAWGGMSNEQISQRLAIIDQLLGVNPSPAVVQALQNARTLLLNGGQQAGVN
jgi:hypothetical protein